MLLSSIFNNTLYIIMHYCPVENLLERVKINQTAKEDSSDRYYKPFKTYHHLITMIYLVLSGVAPGYER